MNSRQTVLLASVASLGLVLAAPALGQSKDEHGHEHMHEEAKSHDEAKALGSVKEAWTVLTAKLAEVDKLVADKKPELIEPIGHDLEGVVKTLSEKSDMVAADKKANHASAIRQLDKAIDGLHHAAEEKDAAAAATEVKKIKSLMPLIEGLYPAGALK